MKFTVIDPLSVVGVQYYNFLSDKGEKLEGYKIGVNNPDFTSNSAIKNAVLLFTIDFAYGRAQMFDKEEIRNNYLNRKCILSFKTRDYTLIVTKIDFPSDKK